MSGRRSSRLLLALLAVGCSSLQGDTSGVVAIEVVSPQVAQMEPGDTINMVDLTLHARALNLEGDSIDAPIRWTSADTLAIIVDSAIPRVVGAATSGSPRLQARVGTLGSTVITYLLSARTDTITLPGSDSVVVPSDNPQSDTLHASLQSYNPAGPVASRRLIFTITSPVFPTPADRTVEFNNGALADTVFSGFDGQPASPVRLSRVTNRTAPDSVVVEVTAKRPSGRPVPGPGRPIVVYFQ